MSFLCRLSNSGEEAHVVDRDWFALQRRSHYESVVGAPSAGPVGAAKCDRQATDGSSWSRASARRVDCRYVGTNRWPPGGSPYPAPVNLIPSSAWRSSSEARARCGNAARRDLCGGRRATAVPTATMLRGTRARRHRGTEGRRDNGVRRGRRNKIVRHKCNSFGVWRAAPARGGGSHAGRAATVSRLCGRR